MRFQKHDGWVLYAVLVYGDEGADLGGLILTGDYCNHAILTYEELHGGLSRLMSAGLVEAIDGRFRATPVARELAAKKLRRLGVFSAVIRLEKVLLAMGDVPVAQQVNAPFTQADVQAAIQEYISRWEHTPPVGTPPGKEPRQ